MNPKCHIRLGNRADRSIARERPRVKLCVSSKIGFLVGLRVEVGLQASWTTMILI